MEILRHQNKDKRSRREIETKAKIHRWADLRISYVLNHPIWLEEECHIQSDTGGLHTSDSRTAEIMEGKYIRNCKEVEQKQEQEYVDEHAEDFVSTGQPDFFCRLYS